MRDDTPDQPILNTEPAIAEPAPVPKDARTLEIEATMDTLVADRGPGKTICPSEVARAIAGKDEKAWRLLMKPIRAVAVTRALDGNVVVKRKGKVVDPQDFRGVYRIGAPE